MIKIASMVGAPDLEKPTLAAYSGDLAAAFQKLAALGYDGVELMTKRPACLDGLQLRRLLEENNLKLTGLCTGHVFGEDGLGLVKPDLTIDRLAVQRLKEFIDFAAAYFEPGIMVNIGRSRGTGDPERLPETLETAKQAFQELADHALPRGVRLILEPVSKDEVNFIHSSQDGIEMVRLVNRSSFGLMLDTYHMAREDTDMFASFGEAVPVCWHIHFSDNNRRWPGSAQIDYPRTVAVLNELSYEGFVTTEIQPWPDPDSAARLSIEHLRQLIPASE